MPQDQQDLVERVSGILLGELTQGGKRDLGAMRLPPRNCSPNCARKTSPG